MSSEELKDAISKYVAFERGKLEALTSFSQIVFEKLGFHTSEINADHCDHWTAILNEKGVLASPVLYYFRIMGHVDNSAICDVITRMKQSPGKSERALPRVNFQNIKTCGNILYVGKTERNFPKRFKEHLGFGNKKTFALNLLHWRTDLGSQLELNFARVDRNQVSSLQGVESAMHYVLRPLLGRSGR